MARIICNFSYWVFNHLKWGNYVGVVQIVVSIRQRKQNLDTTGDPWNGRTLEWATSSPPAFYNFAKIPEVTSRDAFWEMKKNGIHNKHEYEDIEMPKNTALGLYISGFALVFGFAMVWHIFWLAVVCVVGGIVCVIMRTFDNETEYVVAASEIEGITEEKYERKV